MEDEDGSAVKPRLKFYTLDELLALPKPTWNEDAAQRLEYIAALLRVEHLDSAAWRLADLAAELRRKIVLRGWKKVEGVHMRTGRGAMLPLFKEGPHHG